MTVKASAKQNVFMAWLLLLNLQSHCDLKPNPGFFLYEEKLKEDEELRACGDFSTSSSDWKDSLQLQMLSTFSQMPGYARGAFEAFDRTDWRGEKE